MRIESLACRNFRNYKEVTVHFHPDINILYGENAQGKTNILEAIYLAATTRSHRGARDRDMIRISENEANIRLQILKRDVGHRIDMTLRRSKSKGAAVDGIPIRRSAELFGLVPIIFFSPEDLSIVKNGPVERRRFMDMENCQLSRIYAKDLLNYNKILDQRNHLLREIEVQPNLKDTLDVWNQQLVQSGVPILQEREKFLKMIQEIIQEIHRELTGGREQIEVQYQPDVQPEKFAETLKEREERDFRYHATQTGPHRDDFRVLINGTDIRTYGSQGQQRTAALSLKLAEIELLKQQTHDDPVLLLDDVMSELDAGRRDALLKRIAGIQTILTCTGYDEFIHANMSSYQMYLVRNGSVTEQKNQQISISQ